VATPYASRSNRGEPYALGPIAPHNATLCFYSDSHSMAIYTIRPNRTPTNRPLMYLKYTHFLAVVLFSSGTTFEDELSSGVMEAVSADLMTSVAACSVAI
jgi:hypothetical protein